MLRRWEATGWGLALLLCALALLPPAQARAGTGPRTSGPGAGGFSATLDGHIVQHRRVGYQPDFDPIDRVVISAMLRHVTSAGVALPDTMLVLSIYLENFTATTTPLLPDLLHPDQTATGIGGFMQGKAVLVTAAGKKGYDGSVLAEVFLDNTVHLVLDLAPSGASATTPSVRLLGTFTLAGDLSLQGELYGQQPLAARVLRVPPGRPVPWQSVVASLSVHLPPMMGTVTARLPLLHTPSPAPRVSPPSAARPAGSPLQALPRRTTTGRSSTGLVGPAVAATLVLIGVLAAALFLIRRPRPARQA